MTNLPSIVAQVTANPVMVLTDGPLYARFYQGIVDEVNAHVPDVSTDKGRKEIASLAYKVTRTKTAIDAAGKALNEEARTRINTVDAQRRKIRDDLDAVAERARKPLTDWEAAEAQRVDYIKRLIAHIEAVGRGFIGPTLQPFALLFRELDEKITLDAATFGEFLPEAQKAHALSREKLVIEQQRQAKEAEERAELERLRAEAAARLQKEAEEREARQAEAQRQAAIQAAAEAAHRERERIQKEESEKAAAASAAAVKEAQDRAAAAEREKERVQQEAQAKEEAAEAEAARIQREADEKAAAAEAEAQRLRDEEARRTADREHRAKLMGEAKFALGHLGVDEETCRKVVLAIVASEVPHIKFHF